MTDTKQNPDENEVTETEVVIDQQSLIEAVESGDQQQVSDIIESASHQDILRHTSLMSKDEREQFMTLLSPEAAAEILEEAPTGLAASVIKSLDTTVAAKIMEELYSDTQADIINDINQSSADAILSEMKPVEAEHIRELSDYDPHTAGGLMETEILSFKKTDTVRTILNNLIRDDEQYELYRGQHPYIVDDDGRLLGVVSLRDLIRNKREKELTDVMGPAMSVTTDLSQKELALIFNEHSFLCIPVVNEQQVLLGVVSRIELDEAERGRLEIAQLAMQQTGDELRSMPTLLRSRRRLTWLSSNIVLNIIAASVISSYEETLSAVIAIAIFLPMVSDMSGCSGNQAVGVSMRELSLGLTRPVDLFHVLRKELSVGIINGIILGVLIGIVAGVWKDNFYLGLVIGFALSINTLIAVSIGGTIPLILKRLGIDPAVASGPLLTTITDMAGFFLVLSLATAFMPLLVS
jgi:magnesium transporter